MDFTLPTLIATAAAVLVLLVIAVELALLRKDFSRFGLLIKSSDDNKKESPTINVNVGTLAPKSEESTPALEAAAATKPGMEARTALAAPGGSPPGSSAALKTEAPVFSAEATKAALEVQAREDTRREDALREDTRRDEAPLPPLQEPPHPAMSARPIRPQASPAASSGGFGIVKCPKCQSENTSFRGECFNCGTTLPK